MKTVKNYLDERQEQVLLQIEHKGCWLAYWGLLAAVVVQQILYGFDFARVAGEWIIFMALALYLVFSCAKNGIWDRRLRPNVGTNLLISLAAAIAVAAVNFATIFSRYPDKIFGSLAGAALAGISVFVLCFLALSAAAGYTKKKQRDLEEEPKDAPPSAR